MNETHKPTAVLDVDPDWYGSADLSCSAAAEGAGDWSLPSEDFEQEYLSGERIRQAIVETAVDVIITMNAREEILTVNPAALRLLGYKPHEMVGQNINMLMPEPHRSRHREYVQRYLTTGKAQIIGKDRRVVPVQRKDGTVFPARLSVGETAIGDERVFVGILSDISDLKETQEELQHAKEQAEEAHRIQTRALELLVHDLSQPLQASQIYRVLLTDTIERILHGEASDEDPHVLLKNIQRSLAVLQMLTEQLREISKLDVGTTVPQIRDFPLRPLLEGLDAEFRPKAEKEGIEFCIEPNDAVVTSDKKLLYRIVQNFVSNAIKYTSEGSVTIRCRQTETGIRIEVEDTGIGIPSQLQKKIFEYRFQIDNPEGNPDYGYGLGLTIAQRLSGLLGMQIRVESEENRGSVFSIEVPLSASQQIDSPAGGAEAEEEMEISGTVMVIDDDAAVKDSLARAIAGWKIHHVFSTQTELGASVLIDELKQPIVILADYKLRNFCTGAEVIRGMREELKMQVPAILITAETAGAASKAAEALGISFLEKPVDLATLRREINRLMRLQTARQSE